MKEPEETLLCPWCGQTIAEAGYCTACFKRPESDDKLDKVVATLILERDKNPFSIDVRWVRIGRDPTNQIVLNDDRYASRYHAWLSYENGSFWLEDLGSTNGTFLNEHLVEKKEQLRSGDKIKTGETEMTFQMLEDA